LALAIALVALCFAAAPTLASAAVKPADIKTDRVALGAFKQFLGAVHSQATTITQAADAYIASISTTCPNVLAPLQSLTSVNVSAVKAVLTEGGLGMSLAATVSYRAPLTKFGNKVSRLRWTSRSSKLVVKRYLTAEHAVYFMQPSDLCTDATALVTSNGQTTPPATTQALAAIANAQKAVKPAASALIRLLSRFATNADRPVINAIRKLASELVSEETSFANHEVPKLVTALGLTG
jgi:hypothetical protein